MRWPWQRRPADTSHVGRATYKRCTTPREDGVRDPVLAFAQAYSAASGSRTRWNGETLQVTSPDGSTQTYTAGLREADAQATALLPGSAALADMLADVETRTRMSSLRLSRASAPEALARAALALTPRECGHCLSNGDPASFTPCDACPVYGDSAGFAVGASPKRGALRVGGEEAATCLELTYRVSTRDRGGTIEDVTRLAFSPTGHQVRALTHAQIAAALATPIPEGAARQAQEANAHAEGLLRPALDGASAFLRLRSADAYHKRLDDLTATFDRLRREQADDEHSILESLRRELALLSHNYATDVQATLESICFVTSPVAHVFWRRTDGAELTFTVDMGRGSVTTPCSCCAKNSERGVICEHGHMTCVECLPACAKCRTSPQTARQVSDWQPAETGASTALSAEHLKALARFMPSLLAQCAAWLLGCTGFRVTDADPHRAVWHTTREGLPVVVDISSTGCERPVTLADVRRIAEFGAREGARAILLALGPASNDVHVMARALGVELLDRAALDTLLRGLSNNQTRVTSQVGNNARERAAAATKTRDALLRALESASVALTATPKGERVVGAAALASAIATLDEVRRSAGQAFLAWETLIADWLAVFPERITPNGGLVVDADKELLRELRERATHLGKALATVLAQLSRTPSEGELGYDAWRTALQEEYATRCTALRARIAVVDPGKWEDARRARSPEAEAAAERAKQDARHAAARAAKAYARVAQRVGNQ